MTAMTRRERLHEAKARAAAGTRRVLMTYVDEHGLEWEGRVRLINRDPKPVLKLTISGPMQLGMFQRFTGELRLDTNKYVHVSPLRAEPLPWTRPRDTDPVPGVEWKPAIGVLHRELFRAGNVLARRVAEAEAA